MIDNFNFCDILKPNSVSVHDKKGTSPEAGNASGPLGAKPAARRDFIAIITVMERCFDESENYSQPGKKAR